ncbi:ABC transporter permease [Corynebacterium pseudodiphtheriticum]|uniref:ABC transporter permease n=1 Tax=Corynebacterium pseudodiphtheriticum TaxID=37637 RepID=UPI00254F8C27|nr:ABC transporter permease [Corynebacterium pseudodiphtheriticum]MDK8762001.1 ABC transporter permease [Corynebacterium pseudodiphtheriticum]
MASTNSRRVNAATRPASESSNHRGCSWNRYRALAMAEIRQYLRNKTLLFMAIVFPIGVGLLMLIMGGDGQPANTQVRAAISMEVFFLITLMFVQFYSVLSMTTTRRDERVLKRLRTGEARSAEILASLATPGAIMSLLLTVLMSGILIFYTGSIPRTGILLLLAMVLGIVISTGLALLTSSITANAEAAQMTSLPIMVLAMLSQSPLRSALPDQIQNPLARTPFALLGDLTFIEWTGQPLTSDAAPTDGELTTTLATAMNPLALMLVWSIALMWAAFRYMKWETNR